MGCGSLIECLSSIWSLSPGWRQSWAQEDTGVLQGTAWCSRRQFPQSWFLLAYAAYSTSQEQSMWEEIVVSTLRSGNLKHGWISVRLSEFVTIWNVKLGWKSVQFTEMPYQMQLWTSIGKGRYDEVIAFGRWKKLSRPLIWRPQTVQMLKNAQKSFWVTHSQLPGYSTHDTAKKLQGGGCRFFPPHITSFLGSPCILLVCEHRGGEDLTRFIKRPISSQC